MISILIAEDEGPKFSRISKFLEAKNKELSVSSARSVRTTIKQMLENDFDLLLLDMSLPTFDIGEGESGGRPQGFGGLEVVRFLQDEDVETPFIVITQYEEFPSGSELVSVDKLSDMIREEAGESFLGLALFNNVSDAWEAEVSGLLEPILNSEGGDK